MKIRYHKPENLRKYFNLLQETPNLKLSNFAKVTNISEYFQKWIKQINYDKLKHKKIFFARVVLQIASNIVADLKKLLY